MDKNLVFVSSIVQCFSTAVPWHTSVPRDRARCSAENCQVSSTVELVCSSSLNLSIRSSLHFFVSSGRIPIFCVHFSLSNSPWSKLSILSIRHLFFSLRSILLDYYTFSVLLLMLKQLVKKVWEFKKERIFI